MAELTQIRQLDRADDLYESRCRTAAEATVKSHQNGPPLLSESHKGRIIDAPEAALIGDPPGALEQRPRDGADTDWGALQSAECAHDVVAREVAHVRVRRPASIRQRHSCSVQAA